MPKWKELFSTPKKAAVAIACIVIMVAVVIACIALYTVQRPQTDENAAIGGENAKGFAFVDAGVDPADATAVSAKYVRWEEQFVYEVEFIAGDTEYQYKIDALDGSVVKKESKTVKGPEESGVPPAGIELEDARAIALEDAGLEREQVTFTQAELLEDGPVPAYAFRFFAGNVEYDYQINQRTGAVYSMGTTTYLGQGAGEAAPSVQSEPPAAESAPQPSVSVQFQPTPAPAQPSASVRPQPSEGMTPPTADIAPPSANVDPPKGWNASQGQGNSQAQGSSQARITLDEAKQAALRDAGVDESQAVYKKAKLDYEDGVPVYELEFLVGGREYEYEIDAVTGAILEAGWDHRD